MDPILKEFKDDLSRVTRLLGLLGDVKELSGTPLPATLDSSDVFLGKSKKLHEASAACHADIVIVPGTMVLYIGGRFEYFIRSLHIDLCERVMIKAGSYRKLPKTMQENLITFTAEVIGNPRKYGHGPQNVKTFITVLADNLDDSKNAVGINSVCLSITSENMRFKICTEIFDRIGIKDVWSKVCQQAKVLRFFEVADGAQAKNKTEAFLNNFMDERNKIAHPSPSFQWPASAKVEEYVRFFEAIAEAFSDLLPVLELELLSRATPNTP